MFIQTPNGLSLNSKYIQKMYLQKFNESWHVIAHLDIKDAYDEDEYSIFDSESRDRSLSVLNYYSSKVNNELQA